MPKVKVKRLSTFIDMTAMSDVTVLLLTFFMLTSTFVKKEPVQVAPPASVSDVKIPETNIMTIIVEKGGHIFMSMDRQDDKARVLELVGKDYNINFSKEELYQFSISPSFGVPIGKMKEFLALPSDKQDAAIIALNGIPIDSTNNQFKNWVRHAKDVNKDLIFAIKSDGSTPYSTIKNVMNSLQDLRVNRYNLITTLKSGVELPIEQQP